MKKKEKRKENSLRAKALPKIGRYLRLSTLVTYTIEKHLDARKKDHYLTVE